MVLQFGILVEGGTVNFLPCAAVWDPSGIQHSIKVLSCRVCEDALSKNSEVDVQ